jgi:peptide-methionine (S)-S-oxide reductase
MKLIRIFTSYLFLSFLISSQALASKIETATFAGGCFWCLQADLDQVVGVVKTTAGYTGGKIANPTYEQVSNGGTGHYEAVQVAYDPAKISYEDLLTAFWHNIDPTNGAGQFCDNGDQYRAVIFYRDNTQKKIALASKQHIIDSKQFASVAPQVLRETTFYPAEEVHQKYYLKNPVRYNFYRYRCGRDQRLEELWGA